MNTRDRAYQYAKLFRLTTTKKDYLTAVGKTTGSEFRAEAELVWDAIDQWEGDVFPRA